jgi:hypothetical protein
MATVLEEYTNEEQISAVRFSWEKDSMQRIFIKKCFLFTVGSVCRVKWSTAGWQTFRWWRRGWNGGVEVGETLVERLQCCGFRCTSKAMGQVYQYGWRIREGINVFPGSSNICFTFYIYLWPIYWFFLVICGKLLTIKAEQTVTILTKKCLLQATKFLIFCNFVHETEVKSEQKSYKVTNLPYWHVSSLLIILFFT